MTSILKKYDDLIGHKINDLIKSFDFTEAVTDFGYKTCVSAVNSSNIEGNTIDLNSFMNYKLSNQKIKNQKEIKEIEDLITAYEFAQNNELNEQNLLFSHKIFSKSFLIKSKVGRYRQEKVGVFGQYGLVYLAVEPEYINDIMKDFFVDINILFQQNLTESQVFYFTSLIHLIFAHIHPFSDGNGRAARLLEKWFLSSKLGNKYWKLNSEKYYKEHQQEYYNNINLGVNYYEIDYNKCFPFLLMLPNSLEY